MPHSLRSAYLLSPEVVFLNHGSFGACPRPVFEAYQRWQLELERQPVEFLGRRFPDLMRSAREALAAFVGAAAEDLVYVPNATVAVNIVARSLRLQPGDEVLATDHEYGAMDRAWRFVCAKRGARYLTQPVPVPVDEPAALVEAFWRGVTPRTRVIFLSHITSPTALIFPVQAICQRAREAGILCVVDGAHTVGQIPLDLEALGADVYTSNCHKWLGAPKGSAFLYVRAACQPLIEPLIVSWGWQSEAPGPSRFVDEQEWTGTRDIAAYLATPAAIAFQRDYAWDTVRAGCHGLAAETQRRVSALTGLPPLSSPAWFAQMVSLPLPPCEGAALKARLYDEFRVEVPIVTWQDRHFVRVSLQAYNSPGDVDRLIQGLRALLPLVRRS